jgi:hypothetical protein
MNHKIDFNYHFFYNKTFSYSMVIGENKNRILLMLLLMYSTLITMATDIKGIVLNDKKHPIDFANITVFKTNDSLPVTK